MASTDSKEIEIEIDGQKLTTTPNRTIIQVADEVGIYIPRFCYHKHLTAPANCRMCLVEVEKSPKAVPACATPCANGMKVFTRSQKTLAAQRAVMEFLLINHPLDCPICDQGGECELQDISMGYGSSWSHYDECKRSVADENLGPLIATEMTRCIACTRCVRFGDEIAGVRELGLIGRGENVEISTYIEHAVKSEVSGNIIDICPVGALTSKPYRFTARAWELDQAPSISPHDCLGSNLNVHSRYGKTMRVVARENNAINETWISDRDRFGYTGLYHAERLEEPMAKIDGKWQALDWQRAFAMATEGLQDVIAQHGADKIGALASPSCTMEEFYLLQKITRALGSSHVDHRLRETDTRDQAAMPVFPGLTFPLAEIEECDAILLIGSNIQKEQPIAGLRVRKATRKGAAVLVVNSIDHRFNFEVKGKTITAPQHLPATLEEISNVLNGDAASHPVAAHLKNKQKICILLGAGALHHPHASAIRSLAQKIAQQCGAKVGTLTDGANSAGAWLAGAVPHRHAGGGAINHVGMNASEMLHKPRKAYLLLNVEPDLDCANAHVAREAFKQAQCIVALSLYRNAALEEHATIILPMAPFTETSGTYVNAAGEWQSFNGVASAFGSSRPAWKILRVLGNFLHLEGFDYESSEQVRHELHALVQLASPAIEKYEMQDTAACPNVISRIGTIPLYSVDSLVRHAPPLQKMQSIMDCVQACVRMHPETAGRLHLAEGDNVRVRQHSCEAMLPLILDPSVAVDAAWIPGGIAETSMLGDLYGEVEISK
jgi:NADH-quinone oxidoreductase subunit G